ncbi:MAG TPA: DUF4440 domain-containing protein [Gemmatimonadales bacterium]|nr:DUF4440 domain-containing protein [Gemmatimonadales bacterium]
MRWVACAVVIAGCQPVAPAGLADADRRMISQMADSAATKFNAAAASKDWTSYTNTYYADDAIILPANGVTVSGRDAITQMLASYPPMSNVRFSIDEVEGAGDLAYARGTYEMDVAVPGAPAPVHDKGKFIEIWKKQSDGSWKVARDIFNSDLPMESPADTTKTG